MVLATSTNNYANTSIIVSPHVGQGNYNTIAAAVAAASARTTIYIADGTYTEDVVLTTGIRLVSLGTFVGPGEPTAPTVFIDGKISDGGSNIDSSLVGIGINTNSDYAVSVTGAGAITLFNCSIVASNNTPFFINNGSGNIFFINSFLEVITTGISLYNITAGDIWFYGCSLQNPGFSTTTPTGDGIVFMENCDCSCPLASSVGISLLRSTIAAPITITSTGGVELNNCVAGDITSSNNLGAMNSYFGSATVTGSSGMQLFNCRIDSGSQPITISGSGTSGIHNCYLFSGGASSAVSVGSGSSVIMTDCFISSSNTNPITGAGTLQYSNLSFSENSGTVNTSSLMYNFPLLPLVVPITSNNLAGSNPNITSGTGAPTSSQPQGSLYLRTDGSGINTRAYISVDGAGTWTAIVTAS